MIQIGIASLCHPQTISLVPDDVCAMAKIKRGTCVKGTAYYGGFLTSEMSVLKKVDHSRRDQAGWSSPWVLLQSIHRDISDFQPARDLRLRLFSNIHRLPHRHNIKRRPRLAPTWGFWRAHILPTCDGRTCGEHDGIFAESKGRVAAAWESVFDNVRRDAAVATILVAESKCKRRQRDQSWGRHWVLWTIARILLVRGEGAGIAVLLVSKSEEIGQPLAQPFRDPRKHSVRGVTGSCIFCYRRSAGYSWIASILENAVLFGDKVVRVRFLG